MIGELLCIWWQWHIVIKSHENLKLMLERQELCKKTAHGCCLIPLGKLCLAFLQHEEAEQVDGLHQVLELPLSHAIVMQFAPQLTMAAERCLESMRQKSLLTGIFYWIGIVWVFDRYKKDCHCQLAKLTETIVQQTSAQWNTFLTLQSSVLHCTWWQMRNCVVHTCKYNPMPWQLEISHLWRVFGYNMNWSFPCHVPFYQMLFQSWVICNHN